MCAVASALSTGTMTALQADQQDGYDHYAGIFFPCLALLLTACYCVFAAGADPHTQPLQEPCMIFFFYHLVLVMLLGLCTLQPRAGGTG